MKNLTIFKNDYKKEGDNKPDYKIMVAINTGDKLTEAGACWIKESNGKKYMSCKLNDAYADHTTGKSRKGFTLTLDGSNGNQMPDMPTDVPEDENGDIPF